MSTLVFNHEEITARELKPRLYELDGISRESVEAHYKLYQGYIAKRNEILGRLDGVDLSAANQVYSDIRALKVDLTFAIGGIKNHEIYFEHLGGDGGTPTVRSGSSSSGTSARWGLARRPEGDRHGGPRLGLDRLRLGRGRLFNYIGDTQNSYPIWNATPLVALDVYEHAYFLDYQTDRASYIDAFFANLDWTTVNDWVQRYQVPLR